MKRHEKLKIYNTLAYELSEKVFDECLLYEKLVENSDDLSIFEFQSFFVWIATSLIAKTAMKLDIGKSENEMDELFDMLKHDIRQQIKQHYEIKENQEFKSVTEKDT